MLYNFPDQHRGEDAEIEMMDELDAKFSNGKDYFSLARVYLDGCPSTQTLERPSSKIEMTSLCKLKPEIAETGLKGDWRDGYPPIPLFRPCAPEGQEDSAQEEKDEDASPWEHIREPGIFTPDNTASAGKFKEKELKERGIPREVTQWTEVQEKDPKEKYPDKRWMLMMLDDY